MSANAFNYRDAISCRAFRHIYGLAVTRQLSAQR
jgi:hypothetical protein